MIFLNHLQIDSPRTWEDSLKIFNATIDQDINEAKIIYNDQRVKGSLQFMCFNYLEYYQYDFTFTEDVLLELCSGEGEFYFVYCMEGRLRFYLNDSPVNECFSFEPGIFPCPTEGNVSVMFDKESRTRFSIIKLIKHEYPQSPYERNLYDTFDDLKLLSNSDNPFYFGNYNLKIAETIEQLNNLEVLDVTQKYFKEGLLHIILGYHIQQYYQDKNVDKFSCNNLSKEETIAIKATADYICENLEINHSIDSLCKKSGLYACKLQEGFKSLYNRTVIDFIRNERLKEAENMIQSSDYNISQIVYSVGFTSRSYFSKIFKEKYNCSPKVYQKKSRSGNVAE